jgi:ligand-binding sensor domain-containing protein/signal transduction histidine kinase
MNKMEKFKFFIIITLLFYPPNLYTQLEKINFEQISIEHGLSQSSVISICQDHKGFLWFGTYDGLNRYDGFQFKIFKHDPNDSSSLSHNVVKVIYEDHLGLLWLGTEGGLNKYSREKENFIHYKADKNDLTSLSHNRVRDIFEDHYHNLWIATDEGLNLLDRKKNCFKKFYHDPDNQYSISHNFVREIYEDHSGNLWIGTDVGLNLLDRENGRFIRFKNDPNDPTSISGNNILCFAEDRSGSLWIGTWGGGVNRYDQKNNKFIRYQYHPRNPYGLSHNIVRDIHLDQSGELWMGTFGGGLEKYDRINDRYIHFRHNPNDPASLSNDAVYCIFEDNSGILWIGTEFGGLNKFDRKKIQFIHYKSDPNCPKSLNNNIVNTIYEDPDDKGKVVWLGTWGGGLCKFDRKEESFSCYLHDPNNPYSLSNNVVRCIFQDRSGIFWIGTDGGLNRFDRKTEQFISFQCEPNNPNTLNYDNIFCIFEDHLKNLWVGSYYGGLNIFDRKTEKFIRYRYDKDNPNSFNDNIVWCIFEDHSGKLWIGTDAGGLNLFIREKQQFIHYQKDENNANSISDNKVLSICEDKSGILWIGTASGLNRFDPEKEEFRCYNEENGLASGTIQAILEDNQGYLWVSTIRGLTRFNPEKEEFVNFYIQNGLQENEFNVNACCKSISGEIFFGGINGFNLFSPEKIKTNRYIPPIVFTDFQLFNKSVPIGKEIEERLLLKKSITESRELILSHRDYVFSIEFSALDFTAPEKNMYAYMMEGIENKWNYVQNRHFATYTKLPPNKYVFRVKGSNNDGLWNEEGISLKITINPPFWQALWFRVLSIIFILSLVFAGYYIRTASIRQRNRELEIRVKQRTGQLEKTNMDLESLTYAVSHNMRAPLRGMDGFSQILLEDYSKKIDKKGKNYLQRINIASKRMSQLIDDLLKLMRLSRIEINIEEINISKLFQSIIYEYNQMDPGRNISVKIAKDVIVRADLSLLKMLLRNLIDNSWKFTKSKDNACIEFGVTKQGERSIYFVRDNGIGFDMSNSEKIFEAFQKEHTEFEGTGIGLATVKRIVDKHEGQIWAEGRVNEGATIYFTI